LPQKAMARQVFNFVRATSHNSITGPAARTGVCPTSC
jgi:hypothetical protein